MENKITKPKQERIMFSIKELNWMIKKIRKDRIDTYNGTATTGTFPIKANYRDNTLYGLNFRVLFTPHTHNGKQNNKGIKLP